jgi:hypothetical protein
MDVKEYSDDAYHHDTGVRGLPFLHAMLLQDQVSRNCFDAVTSNQEGAFYSLPVLRDCDDALFILDDFLQMPSLSDLDL